VCVAATVAPRCRDRAMHAPPMECLIMETQWR
jgi:hypothetical protein